MPKPYLRGAHAIFPIGNLGMRIYMNENQMKELVNVINTKNYKDVIEKHNPYKIPQMGMVRNFYSDEEIKNFYNMAMGKKVKRK